MLDGHQIHLHACIALGMRTEEHWKPQPRRPHGLHDKEKEYCRPFKK